MNHVLIAFIAIMSSVLPIVSQQVDHDRPRRFLRHTSNDNNDDNKLDQEHVVLLSLQQHQPQQERHRHLQKSNDITVYDNTETNNATIIITTTTTNSNDNNNIDNNSNNINNNDDNSTSLMGALQSRRSFPGTFHFVKANQMGIVTLDDIELGTYRNADIINISPYGGRQGSYSLYVDSSGPMDHVAFSYTNTEGKTIQRIADRPPYSLSSQGVDKANPYNFDNVPWLHIPGSYTIRVTGYLLGIPIASIKLSFTISIEKTAGGKGQNPKKINVVTATPTPAPSSSSLLSNDTQSNDHQMKEAMKTPSSTSGTKKQNFKKDEQL